MFPLFRRSKNRLDMKIVYTPALFCLLSSLTSIESFSIMEPNKQVFKQSSGGPQPRRVGINNVDSEKAREQQAAKNRRRRNNKTNMKAAVDGDILMTNPNNNAPRQPSSSTTTIPKKRESPTREINNNEQVKEQVVKKKRTYKTNKKSNTTNAVVVSEEMACDTPIIPMVIVKENNGSPVSMVIVEENSNNKASTTHLSNVTFDSLKDISLESKKAIDQVLHYEYLTKVQHATLDSVMSGADVMAKAKTGTGKTVAFLLPIIERMIKSKSNSKSNNKISGLILSPTRELAMQIEKEAKALCTFHKQITIGCFIGGTNINQDIKKLRNGLDILIVTPGRLVDHILNNNENIRNRITQLDTLILDEADQLLDMGFKKAIDEILSYLPSANNRQTLMYSATFTESVKTMAKRALKTDHLFIDTIEVGEQQTNTHVPQEHVMCTLDTLTSSLESIILNHMKQQPNDYKILVFSNTARTAGFMAQLFQNVGYNALEMHSRKSQTYRVKVAKQFHDGTNIIMFSSDVSARGVDYPNVSLIIQIGLTDKEQYIHRLGRTGRAGRTGRGVLLLCDYEKSFLKELKDLDIVPGQVPKNDTGVVLKATSLLLTSQERSYPNELIIAGEQAYQAFLGYYNSNTKRINMNKIELVQLANHYSRTIGFIEPPKLEKKTIGKMGMKGVPGLRSF